MSHRLILFGATGMVGGEALTRALAHPEVEAVTTVGRRATGRKHAKLTEVVHPDFADLSSIEVSLANHTALLFCLGAYTGTVADEYFRQITVDFAVEAGRAIQTASPSASFLLLSGMGADRSLRARASFARYKGMAEKALLEMDFPRLHLFRPGYIHPTVPRKEPNVMYRVSRWLWPVLGTVFPNAGISSRDLAHAMVHAALHGTGPHVDPTLENSEIRALVARIPPAA